LIINENPGGKEVHRVSDHYCSSGLSNRFGNRLLEGAEFAGRDKARHEKDLVRVEGIAAAVICLGENLRGKTGS
jgi:hypothetical protein